MNPGEHPRSGPHAEAAQLAPSFEAGRLKREVIRVIGHRWQPQRITSPGGGVGSAATIDWRVLPLRSPGGDASRTDPGGPGPADFASTAWMDRLPYLAGILESIPAPLNAVRLMALGPGSVAQAHRDPKYALRRGLLRMHIPLITNPGAALVIDGVEHCWQPGTLWYGDFSLEHWVRNTGGSTRIHAVIDALLTTALAELFPADWDDVFASGEALFNRPPLETSSDDALPGAYTAHIPCGFTDFGQDQPLEGPLQIARVKGTAGHVSLITADRSFALVPVAPGEFRFAGWSEQRTLRVSDEGVVLRGRAGRAVTERRLPAVMTPSALPNPPSRMRSPRCS